MKKNVPLFLFVVLIGYLVDCGTSQNLSEVENITATNINSTEINSQIIGINWDHVETPMLLSIWLLTACIAKILFHVNKSFGEFIPDSALLIIVGLILGYALKVSNVDNELYYLDAQTFFLYLLPPIMFDGGYFMPNRQLFDNIGSVFTFAIVGTVWNTLAIGTTLTLGSYYGLFSVPVTNLEIFLFASLISAVDPVAVISVFEEIHVNEFLFTNVFGEALFNDGIAAVIFQIFKHMTKVGVENLTTVSYAIFGSLFFVIAIGGIALGVLSAFVCSLATRFTQRVKIVGPVFIFVIPYMAYLLAEMLGLSSILTICICGIVMKQYVKENITHEAASAVKYFVKLLAQSSETVVFMFLGLSTMSSHQHFDFWFVVLTLIACFVYRAIGVLIQCAVLNRTQTKQFTLEDQFILAYGGLRGAIAFGLLSSVPDTIQAKEMFSTTTIFLICFTVFLQGTTIRPILSMLKVETFNDEFPTMLESIHSKCSDYAVSGIEDIIGQKGKNAVRSWFERLNSAILKPLLIKNSRRTIFDATQIVRAYKKVTLREALEMTKISHLPSGEQSERPPLHREQSMEDRKAILDEFLSSPQNTDALYSMFSQLLDRKLRQFEASTQKPIRLSSNPRILVTESPEADDEDGDIKDDYIEILRSAPSSHRRLTAGLSEPIGRQHSPISRRASQPERNSLDPPDV